MDERQSKRASSSSTSVIGNNYYVFLSFRGPDTRKGFVDHLYYRLRDVGLPFHPNFVFRDDNDLPFGEDIGKNLIDAIKHSKVSIPIISEKYAASEWCLRELIQIMKCGDRGEQKVLPVLYKVKPNEVRQLRGAFGKAFKSSMGGFKEDVKQQGPEALRKAADSRVFESEKFASGREGELINELIEIITREQQRDFPPSVSGDSVGIDDRVAEVMKLLDTTTPEIQTIAIYGIGGIGKTTLAESIYKKLSEKFKYRSFLRDIRETVNRKGMEQIQSQLISNITHSYPRTVPDSDTGIGWIKSSCKDKNVLILLDDVGHRNHLDKLIGGCKFGSESRIIITCRDKALLKSEYKEYELIEMNRESSLLLFNKCAFEGEQPSSELIKALSKDIVGTTGGVPLSLEVIGSFLKGKHENIWKETLEKLKKAPHKDVQKSLRISYDSLEYEEQQMFLDIACFFIGIDKRIATYLWEDLLWCKDSGLDRLIELSLVKFGGDDDDDDELIKFGGGGDDDDEPRMPKLRMHDHLRDLGKAIACPVDKRLWECRRLWDEEAIIVQRSKDENRYVEALHLDKKGSSMFMKRRSFERMPYLKFLHLSTVNFARDFEDSLSELRWLEWEMCPNSFEPTNVHLEKLLILNLSGGFISEEWLGWALIKMEKLKVLNLSRCSHLKSAPNLSRFKKLEMLILESCSNLEEIGPSIEHVECPVSLNVRYCQKLKKLPDPELGKLKNLEELLVDGTSIKEIPDCIRFLKKLKMLSAWDCVELFRVSKQLGEVKGLVSLDLSGCWKLRELPEEMCELKELKKLTIGMTGIQKLPPCIGLLEKLEMLDASYCESLEELPDSIGRLVNLSTLKLKHCHKLDELPESIGSLVKLQRLFLQESLKLPNGNGDAPVATRIPNSIDGLVLLTKLNLSCTDISELPESIGDLKNLRILYIACCEKLTNLPSTICKLDKLEELDASYCKELGEEVRINGMSSLRILQLCETSIFGFSDAIDKLSHLEKLDLRGCGMLESLPQSIGKLPSLQRLDLTYCKKLRSLPKLPANLTILRVTCRHRTLPRLSHLIHLEELIVEDCKSLESMPELPLGLLELRVIKCGKLKDLPSLSSLESLSILYVGWCSKLTKIEGLEALKSLQELNVYRWRKLSNLHGLEHVESLRCLKIYCDESGDTLWNDDLSLVKMKNLEMLIIRDCKSLTGLALPQPTTHLKYLNTSGCSNLADIKGLRSLENLETWYNHDCTSLDKRLLDHSLFPKIEESRWGDEGGSWVHLSRPRPV